MRLRPVRFRSSPPSPSRCPRRGTLAWYARGLGSTPSDGSMNMIRCRPTAGRWPLTPAIEVRVLAPEQRTGSQVARHAPAKRGTWVRFPPGARSLTSRRRVLPDGQEPGFSLRKPGFDSRTRYRQCPGRRIGPDATNVGGVVQLHAGVPSRRRRKVCRLFRIQDIGLVRFQPPRPRGDCKAAGSPTKSHGRERYPDPVPTDIRRPPRTRPKSGRPSSKRTEWGARPYACTRSRPVDPDRRLLSDATRCNSAAGYDVPPRPRLTAGAVPGLSHPASGSIPAAGTSVIAGAIPIASTISGR